VLKSEDGRAIRGRVLGVMVALAGVLASGNAFATAQRAPGQVQRSKLLRYQDSALASPDGARKMYTRLVVAARQVCKNEADGVLGSRDATRCERQAISAAVAKVDNEFVTAIHLARAVRARERALRNAWLNSATPCAQCV
jgi:UrcA family protein